MMRSEDKAGNFVTLVYSILLNTGKNMLEMAQTLWKNCLTTAKDVQIIHVNFIVTAIKFSEVKNGGITFILSLIQFTMYNHWVTLKLTEY
jgi:hypothetical protein